MHEILEMNNSSNECKEIEKMPMGSSFRSADSILIEVFKSYKSYCSVPSRATILKFT